jgi:hypothetical protein
MEGNILYLVYNTVQGIIVFETYTYNSPNWTRTRRRNVYSTNPDFDFRAQKPSIAKDSDGRIWIGFMDCNMSTVANPYNTKVYYAEEDNDYTDWVDAGFDDVGLGSIVNTKTSIRLLNHLTYIYAIVSSEDTFYHTYIVGPPSGTNNWAQLKTIYTISELIPEDELMNDPNRAHFSAVVRVDGNMPYIHFVTNNSDQRRRRVVYASYRNSDESISTKELQTFNLDTRANYPQISKYASGELYISYDIWYIVGTVVECRGLVILEEEDEGLDWAVKDQLVLPGTLPTCETRAARSMTPELVPDDNHIPVFQQIRPDEDPNNNYLVIYEVPPPPE